MEVINGCQAVVRAAGTNHRILSTGIVAKDHLLPFSTSAGRENEREDVKALWNLHITMVEVGNHQRSNHRLSGPCVNEMHRPLRTVLVLLAVVLLLRPHIHLHRPVRKDRGKRLTIQEIFRLLLLIRGRNRPLEPGHLLRTLRRRRLLRDPDRATSQEAIPLEAYHLTHLLCLLKLTKNCSLAEDLESLITSTWRGGNRGVHRLEESRRHLIHHRRHQTAGSDGRAAVDHGVGSGRLLVRLRRHLGSDECAAAAVVGVLDEAVEERRVPVRHLAADAIFQDAPSQEAGRRLPSAVPDLLRIAILTREARAAHHLLERDVVNGLLRLRPPNRRHLLRQRLRACPKLELPPLTPR
jgi:hypothetical protein